MSVLVYIHGIKLKAGSENGTFLIKDIVNIIWHLGLL